MCLGLAERARDGGDPEAGRLHHRMAAEDDVMSGGLHAFGLLTAHPSLTTLLATARMQVGHAVPGSSLES